MADQTHEIWLSLAELFFLDTEPQPRDFARMSDLLKSAGWSKAQTESVLVELIAPVAGGNVGYLVFPVIGEWAGFDRQALVEKVRVQERRRKRRPKWTFLFSDWWCRRMLVQLELQRLLDLL